MAGFVALALLPSAAVAETWIVRTDLWGNPAFSTLELDRKGKALAGVIDGDRVSGEAAAARMRFESKDRSGIVSRYTGTVTGERMTGTVDAPDTNDRQARAAHAFTAWRVPPKPAAPRNIDLIPGDYSNTFNADRTPLMILWPGDRVDTQTIDSGGVDGQGKTRALFGNPQTGPFFVAGAEAGDTLVVRLRMLRLNRDTADSLDTVVGRALGASLAGQAGELGKPVRWKLDRETMTGRPENGSGALANLSVPLRPMLGGLAVAPGFGSPPVSTGDTGRFGGNMDFNEVVEGNIVYLPVQQPGALLYLGDGHAAQGDGETSQYALETSLDVSFVVDLIKGKAIAMPRVESPDQIMVLGQAGSLDEALKAATTGMIQWLQQDYGLTLSQAGQLMGAALKTSVANLAGRSVGVAAKIDKALLPPSRGIVSKP